jgi:hypothetical protein
VNTRFAALLLLLLLPLAANAQAGGWTIPHKIESATSSNWFPSLAVDPWGDVHLIWSSGKGEGATAKDLLMYSYRHNGAWLPSNDIVQPSVAGYAARNSIAVDRMGRLHVLVRGRNGIFYTSASSKAAWSANAWRELHKINGLGMAYYPAIAVGPNGFIHVVWQELAPRVNDQSCQFCSDVWYRRSEDGGAHWTAPVNLSQGKTGSSKPQIVIDGRERIFVTWDEGRDPIATGGTATSIAYAVSIDQGRRWQPPTVTTLPNDAPEQATLGVDGKDNLVLVFRATASSALLFRWSDDGGSSWTDPAPIPDLIVRSLDDTPWDKYSMATDSAGNLHLLAVARRTPGETVPGLYHLVWSGAEQRWRPPELLSTNELYPEWPQLVIAEGNRLHATWFTRSAGDLHTAEKSAYQVWYSSRTVDAPTMPVDILPTPTPRPTETPTVVVVQTAAQPPLPVEAMLAPQPTSVRSEAPILRYIGIALLPTLMICLIALVIGLRRRML